MTSVKAICRNPVCPISLFEHTVGHGECAPTSTGPTAPTSYLDSEFAADALAEVIRYGMDNDKPPAEVASNVLAHLKMQMQFHGERPAQAATAAGGS